MMSTSAAGHGSNKNGAVASAVPGAPHAWNRPTLTGAGGSDPLWLCWCGRPRRGPARKLRRIRMESI